MLRAQAESPLRLLLKSVSNNILVKLKDGSEIVGILERCDPCMNLVLSDAREISEENGEMLTNYGKMFIRGSNVLFIAIDYSKVSYQ